MTRVKRNLLTTIILILASATCCVAFAQKVYKWTDKDGNVHFTDQPPPEENVKEVEGVQTTSPQKQAPSSTLSSPTDPNESVGGSLPESSDEASLACRKIGGGYYVEPLLLQGNLISFRDDNYKIVSKSQDEIKATFGFKSLRIDRVTGQMTFTDEEQPETSTRKKQVYSSRDSTVGRPPVARPDLTASKSTGSTGIQERFECQRINRAL